MAPFCDIQKKRVFALSPPRWHSTTTAPCYDRTPLPPPSLSLSLLYSSSLGLSETMQTAAATALLSDCHSGSSSSPLQPMGYIWQHTVLGARQSAWAQREEPSARADIFQGLFQQMEFLQVPFGVKYLAGGCSIWFITNWMACPAFSSSASHLQALSPPPFMLSLPLYSS